MIELIAYVNDKIQRAKMSRFRDNAMHYESQAFGAVELFVRLHPEKKEKALAMWSKEWHPIFVQQATFKDM